MKKVGDLVEFTRHVETRGVVKSVTAHGAAVIECEDGTEYVMGNRESCRIFREVRE